MGLVISSELQVGLAGIAAAAHDEEVCGLLLGTPDHVLEIRQTRNVASDPSRTFELDPSALFAALREERAEGPTLVGYFHSHPTGDLRPSRADFDLAQPDGRTWLIIAGGGLAAWRRTPDAFVAVEIVTS